MSKKIQVMVNGLPGKMATMLVKRLAQDPMYEVIPRSFTGPEVTEDHVTMWINEKADVISMKDPLLMHLIKPQDRSARVKEILERWPDVIIVDYTQPDATQQNCYDYCTYGIPFVMGTTGGDRDALALAVEESRISAVIAPNMSVPIVALMAMIEKGAADFPNALKDFELLITESHQSPKRDKSGTGKAIGEKLRILGANYAGEEDIIAIRDPKQQRFLGIPEEALGGHGWHSYALKSPDGSVSIKIEHNINGRQTYVEGTLKAINFLAKKIDEDSFGDCFSMIDVMKG